MQPAPPRGRKPPRPGRRPDAHLTDQVEALQERGDVFARQIEVEKALIRDLDEKLARARETMFAAEKEMGGHSNPTVSIQRKEREIAKLENVLDKKTKQLNSINTGNRALREQINNLRREKTHRAQVKERLEKELAEKKQQLAAVVEASQAAYDARDEVQERVEALRETIAREVAEFEVEWRERMKRLEDDAKQRKTQREADKLGATEAARSVPRRKDLQQDSAKAMWDIARKEVDLKKQEERVREYEEAFEKMRTETGITSVEAMVDAFVESEERNFGVINMINELHKEAEGLEAECVEHRKVIEKLRGRDEVADAARQKVFDDLEARITKAKTRTQLFEGKHAEAGRVLDALRPGVWAMFECVGCGDANLAAQLATTGVTDGNLAQFLGVIEERVTEVLQLQHMALAREDGADTAEMLHDARALPASPRNPHGSVKRPALPSVGTMYADDDGDDGAGDEATRPLSIAQLKAEAAKQAEPRR